MTLADGSRRQQCSISEIGLSTKPARSLEKFMEGSGDQPPSRRPAFLRRAPSSLGWWAIVLIKLPRISLLAKFEKGLHLFLHEFSTALFAQINLILVDDHDPHAFPLFPAGFADLGFDLRFKPPHEDGIRDNFSGLSARDALNVCHGVRILPHNY